MSIISIGAGGRRGVVTEKPKFGVVGDGLGYAKKVLNLKEKSLYNIGCNPKTLLLDSIYANFIPLIHALYIRSLFSEKSG